MLAKHYDRFIDPRLAELGDYDPQAGEGAGDFVQQVGAAILELALFSELAAGMKQDGHLELFGLGVNLHRPRVAWVEVLIGRGDGDAGKTERILGRVNLFRRTLLGGINSSKSD